MIEKVAESIRTDVKNLEPILKMLESPALKKILVDQDGDCGSQIQLFEQIGDESKAQAMREIDRRIKQAFSEHDSMHVTDALPQVIEQIRDEIETLNLALKMLETPALKKIIIDQKGDCESQAQLFEQIGDESRARAIREIGKRVDQIKRLDQIKSDSGFFKKTVTIKNLSWASKQALFVSVVAPTAINFKSKIQITFKGITADAKSSTEIMLKFFPFNLFASSFFSTNVDVTISAEGEDAEKAVSTLVNLLESFPDLKKS